jgi:hypothetical protein
MTVFEILDEYVHAKKNDIDSGNPVIVEVRDTDTFERLIVKAHIAPPGKDLEGGDELVLRNLAENIAAEGWKIRVLEELDPEGVEIKPESAFRKDAGPNV